MIGYTGSGPYCYTHSVAMMLGAAAPPPAVIETLTGAPFGFTMLGGTLPLFDPYGWDPEIGLDCAITALGWSCDRIAGGTSREALDRLRDACADGPVLVGPVDIRLLSHQSTLPPDGGADQDAVDHYLVVLEVGEQTVLLHDPQGYPYATLPIPDFVGSWRAERVAYVDEPFVQRTGFVRERDVDTNEALRSVPAQAIAWLSGRTDRSMPPGTVHGAEAVHSLAEQVGRGLDGEVREMLVEFAVRVGARRLIDAASCLRTLGLDQAFEIVDEQARIVGALQHPLVGGEDEAVITGLRRLAPTYDRLRIALQEAEPQPA